MRRSRRAARGILIGGVLAGSLSVGAGAAVAQGVPAPVTSPGFSQASTVGSCHGVFGDYFGGVLSSDPAYFSSLAPLGNQTGQNNAVGSCPYQGVPAPVFPPGS